MDDINVWRGMHIPRALLVPLCMFLCTHVAAAGEAKESAEESATIVLPPHKVFAEWFVVSYQWTMQDGVTNAVVTEVLPDSPPAKGDLRDGDVLLSIDHVPVAGLSVERFEELSHRTIDARHPKLYSFKCERGLFGAKAKVLNLTIVSKEAKPSPNHAAEPPPGAGH